MPTVFAECVFHNSFNLVYVGHSGKGGEVVVTGCPCQRLDRHGNRDGRCELFIFSVILYKFELT